MEMNYYGSIEGSNALKLNRDRSDYGIGFDPMNHTPAAKMKLFGNDNFNFNYPFSYQNFDLQGMFVKNPASSFLIKVKGDSMIGAGINTSDVLLVDKKAEIREGSVVVAEINSKLVVKRISFINGRITLNSENIKYTPIEIADTDEFEIWGVVQSVIKTM